MSAVFNRAEQCLLLPALLGKRIGKRAEKQGVFRDPVLFTDLGYYGNVHEFLQVQRKLSSCFFG